MPFNVRKNTNVVGKQRIAEVIRNMVKDGESQMLRSYHVDKAVVSCKGFDMENGITDSNELHARNKKTMLERADQGILAVDSSKFGYTAFAKIGELDNIKVIITDEEPEEKWLHLFEGYGVECIWPNKKS